MSRNKHFSQEREEKKTEIFRIHLERSSAMDTLTGWTQKLVEVHDNAPPTDVRAFMEEKWNNRVRSVIATVYSNAMRQARERLAEVQKKNETLRAQIADMETKLLQRRVAALDLASEKLKEKPVPAVRKKAPSSAGF